MARDLDFSPLDVALVAAIILGAQIVGRGISEPNLKALLYPAADTAVDLLRASERAVTKRSAT